MGDLSVSVVRDMVEEHQPLVLDGPRSPEFVVFRHIRIGGYIDLDAAQAIRAIPNNGRRHNIPAQGSADQVGSSLSRIERSVAKVMEWALSNNRLVNSEMSRHSL